ncbi:MAG: FkbM family methyltransferase [Candidatus Acidiferrales bacterium]
MNQRDNSKAVSESCSAALQSVEIATGFALLLKPEDYITQLLLRDGVFEPSGTDLVARLVRPGDVCVDAGCHVGYYTCLLAHLVGPTGHVYAFDANPESCVHTRRNLDANHLENAEIIQAALGDQRGTATFYVSTDDQTGLSSLGPIPRHKEAIVVPWLRLQDFFRSRRIPRVRLLKLDVEGAEELVLRGLSRFLTDQRIDFILIECYDERLELLNSSTERVAGLLHDAGYRGWEFGTLHSSGWSVTPEIRSRGDSNYLFARPSARDGIPTISLVGALLRAQAGRDAWEKQAAQTQQAWEKQAAQAESQLQSERQAWQGQVAQLQEDITWLWDGLHKREEAASRLRQEKSELEAALNAIENSPGWRLLNTWRWFRDRLAPEQTWRRRLYEAGLNRFRRGG